MMKLNFQQIAPSTFVKEYWQQQPLVIRQGLSGFTDLLTADEMAGLAMEPEVESRLIWQEKGHWQAQLGPFEQFDQLAETDWTLVVQALNHWIPKAESLAQCFDFIPRWRFDDVMASFAVTGGGVGPHIDRYDVFICQGSGRRRWRVGNKGLYRQFAAHEALLHSENFNPIIDVELLPGDILYLPSGFPHQGVALEPSMSFSVGYRSATAKDMFCSFADYLIDNGLGEQQIVDSQLSVCDSPAIIDNQDLLRLKQQLLAQLNDEVIADFFGRMLTQSKCELNICDDSAISIADWQSQIQHLPLHRVSGLKVLYLECNYLQGYFYLNGELEIIPKNCVDMIPILCNSTVLTYSDLKPWLNQVEFYQLMAGWLKQGYWYFDE